MSSFTRGLGLGTAFALSLAASWLGNTREASACSPPPEGWFPSGIAPAPANGVVLLRYACHTGCETPPAVETLALKNEENELVPGSVVFTQARASEFVLAFRPETGALSVGGVYTAELEGVSATGGILIGPAATWSDALTLTDQIFEVDHPAGETQCCTGPLDLCSNLPCFRPQVDRRTTVTVGWYDSQSIEHYQYVFRLGRDSIDPAAPWSWDGGDARFELDAAEESACYVLEVKRLTDDSVQTFASRCVERPATFTPGLHDIPDQELSSVLRVCDDPPDGYESDWCEARADFCETSPDEVWCADLAMRCAMVGAAGAAGGTSVAGAAGNGGKAGSTGAGGNAGIPGGGAGSAGTHGGAAGQHARGGTTSVSAGTGGTAEAGAPDGEAGEAGGTSAGKRVLTKGCGCSVPGNASRTPASLVLAFALVALRLRRRGRRS